VDPNVIIGNRSRAAEIKLKLKLGARRTQEPVIALAQQIEKSVVIRGQGNRDSSDLDTRDSSERGHHKDPTIPELFAEQSSAACSGFRKSRADAFRRL